MELSEIEPLIFIECSSSIKQENNLESTESLNDALKYSQIKQELDDVNVELTDGKDVVSDVLPSDPCFVNCDQPSSSVIDIADSSSGGSSPIVVEDDVSPESPGFTLSKDLMERLEAIADRSHPNTKDIKYSCSHCDFSCSVPREMADHQSKCWVDKNMGFVNEAVGEHNSVNFQCSVTLINGQMTYCCQLCDFTTRSNKIIKRHCFDSHKDQGSCGKCGKVYKHFGSLARHVKRAHPAPARAQKLKPVHSTGTESELVLSTLNTFEDDLNSSIHKVPNESANGDVTDDSQMPKLDTTNFTNLKHEVIEIIDIQDHSNLCEEDLMQSDDANDRTTNETSQIVLSSCQHPSSNTPIDCSRDDCKDGNIHNFFKNSSRAVRSCRNSEINYTDTILGDDFSSASDDDYMPNGSCYTGDSIDNQKRKHNFQRMNCLKNAGKPVLQGLRLIQNCKKKCTNRITVKLETRSLELIKKPGMKYKQHNNVELKCQGLDQIHNNDRTCTNEGTPVTITSRNKVSVAKSGGTGKRVWDKRYCCCYCKGMVGKLSRHLQSKHSNEKLVQQFIALPLKGYEREKIIAQLRSRGNFIYNSKAVKEGRLIIPKRRPSTNNKVPSDYLPCEHCGTFYLEKGLIVHTKKCIHKSQGMESDSIIRKGVHARGLLMLHGDLDVSE